jgi:hypothetical protein|tara:strand:- start:4323 stop:4601 length:279 start_codon:yes stop_codon:yes gene_type:complete
MEIKQNKLSLDKLLLNDAIRLEHLPKGSKFEDLTPPVKEQVVNDYILRDSLKGQYLPEGSTIKDLTPQIKQKMIDEKAFSVYNLDGTLKSNV